MENTSQSLQISVTGRVQGVGFRPFVSRIANQFNLAGWVQNLGGRVEIRVEGKTECLTGFIRALVELAPPLAKPEIPQAIEMPLEGLEGFAIRHSQGGEGSDIHIPPDYFVCKDCLSEMQNPGERRHRYPFINCTQCGPRYTLIARLPYDRPNTSMARFELCPACRSEYENPLDRRYHAQPLACAACGPGLLYRVLGQADIVGNEPALDACIQALQSGLIVAVKGVGGYHLLCDARSQDAVLRLRQRKHRPAKPLAVLIPDRDERVEDGVFAVAAPQLAELELLQSPLRPIVLVKKRWDSDLAESVAPGLAEIGIMLPYSPLHHLLADGFNAPLVATSANISGEPVLTEAAEVEKRLGGVADAFLHHDRPILRPADDSVFRLIAGRMAPIRLGRGLAPVERELPFELENPLLAVGADMKNTVALAFGGRVVISPHIGDLGAMRSGEVFEQVIADLQALYCVKPAAVVCDAHPDYHSSRWARRQALPLTKVWHHHAHASALTGEHGATGETLVFTWDGVGYGEDGTIWGCETLLGQPGGWRRVASLRPFKLLGGDKANREPWRCALALCWEAGLEWPGCPHDSALLRQAYKRDINCPTSSSAGRLFDAAAALTGLACESSFEGEAAMRFEALAEACGESLELGLSLDRAGLCRADWSPLLPMLMDSSLPISERASMFHASLANLILRQAEKARAEQGIERIGLTGGVFQNRLLTEQALLLLEAKGFEVLLPTQIPANDAGLGFGQLIEAAAIMNRRGGF